MNKLTSNVGTVPWLRMMLVLLTLIGCATVYAQAPVEITQFYPAKVENLQQIKHSTVIYVYLHNLTDEAIKVTELDFRLIQNGNVLGEQSLVSNRVAQMPASGTGIVAFRVGDYDLFNSLEQGPVTLQIYGVTYYDASGWLQHYVDADNIIDEVTYQVKSRPVIVSTEGLSDGKFHSYYAEDDEDGVLKIHISVPVQTTGISAYLTYGTANLSAETDVPWSVSEDRMTVMVDFRGEPHTSAILSQGLTFTDDAGNVIIPTRVSLAVTNIRADDGALLEGEFISPTGSKVAYSGAYFAFDLVDESFPTPVMREAKFYDSANPSVTYNNMLDITDMMVVTILGAQYITSADMVITCGDVKATIPYKDITVGEDTYTVTLPRSIRDAKSTNMVISLENVTFIEDDGVNHEIRPLDLSSAVTEVFSIAEAKALALGTDFILNTTDMVVSFSNGGYIFMEDATDGVRILMGPDTKFEKGETIVGKFAGCNVGGNSFTYRSAKSDFVTATSTLYTGIVIEDPAQLLLPENQCRYVSVVASKDLPITLEDGEVNIGENVVGVLDLYQFDIPESIESVTGVLYEMTGTKILIVSDFNLVSTVRPGLPEFNSIGELKEAAPEGEVFLSLNNAVVTYVTPSGEFFVEDETGAFMMFEENYAEVPAMGTMLKGEVRGTYYPNGCYFQYKAEDLVYEAYEEDVTVGEFVSPEQILSGDYNYRLVTVTTDYTSIVKDGSNYGMVIGLQNPVYVVDMFGAVEDYNWDFPAGAKLVTGIVYPVDAMQMFKADDDEELEPIVSEQNIFLAIRSEEDVTPLDTFTSIQDIRLNAKDGDMIIVNLDDTKITYTMDEAYFAEDPTAAIMVFSYKDEDPMTEGTLINGTMVALYSKSEGLSTYPQWCQFDLSTCDVATGMDMSAADIYDPLNDCRLVSLTNEDHWFNYVGEGIYLIDNSIYASLLEETEDQLPTNIKQITGVIFRDYASEDEKEFGDAVIIIRTPEDIVADNSSSGLDNTINTNPAAIANGAVYNLKGMKLNNSDETLKGIFIVGGQKVILK